MGKLCVNGEHSVYVCIVDAAVALQAHFGGFLPSSRVYSRSAASMENSLSLFESSILLQTRVYYHHYDNTTSPLLIYHELAHRCTRDAKKKSLPHFPSIALPHLIPHTGYAVAQRNFHRTCC